MSGYEFSPEALDDLQEIWVWISQDNPAAADEFEAEIYAACEILAKNPLLGHMRSYLSEERILFWNPEKRYVVAYAHDMKPLKIVRLILHAARVVSVKF